MVDTATLRNSVMERLGTRNTVSNTHNRQYARLGPSHRHSFSFVSLALLATCSRTSYSFLV